MADGLARVIPASDLTVIVNTGDDFTHLGLRVCADLDTVVYTLAGLASEQRGWGRSGETWNAMETLGQVGAPTWFKLGDRDLGLHLWRTERLAAGVPLSEFTAELATSLGIQSTVLPMTDSAVATFLETDEGTLPFQTYFVERGCEPRLIGIEFRGAANASPAAGVLKALEAADAVIICPSNPWVSIDPILAVSGIRQAVERKPVVAVTPLISGKAVKGPAAKMAAELGLEPGAVAVAQHYGGLLSGFVLDRRDATSAEAIRELGLVPRALDTLMRTSKDRKRLAGEVVAFTTELLERVMS